MTNNPPPPAPTVSASFQGVVRSLSECCMWVHRASHRLGMETPPLDVTPDQMLQRGPEASAAMMGIASESVRQAAAAWSRSTVDQQQSFVASVASSLNMALMTYEAYEHQAVQRNARLLGVRDEEEDPSQTW